MKKYILMALFVLSSTAMAGSASVRVEKFDLEFYMDTSKYELDFELEMACRYEKFVISDSSEYEYIYKDVPLTIKKKRVSSKKSLITVSNKENRELKIGGFFRSNKGCQTYLNFFIKSKKYSIGWANQFNRPIRLGHFVHSRVEYRKTFDIAALKNIFEDKEVSFNYKPVRSQVNVRLAFDGVSTTGMSSYLFTSTAIDSETDMPYVLRH
jgi:hypothetical protein